MSPWESKAPNGVNGVALEDEHVPTLNNKPPVAEGAADNDACDEPVWQRERQHMMRSFPAYYADPTDDFRNAVDGALSNLQSLRQQDKEGPVHFGSNTPFWSYHDKTTSSSSPAENIGQLSTNGLPLDNVVSDMVSLFDGINNVAHPLFQYNVICHPNKAAIIAYLLGNYVSPNYISGHSGWNTTKAEVETAAIVSNLAPGWSPETSGGFFTFGGSGCYLYGLKYALTDVLQQYDTRRNGIPNKGKLITSQHGHFCNTITTDWLGRGTNSVIKVKTRPRINDMDMQDLERILQQCQREQEPVILIVCTMGTTDSMAIDPIDKVSALLDKYPNPPGYPRPHIYCDSVAGWAFLTFQHYDFEENPLQFSESVCVTLQENLRKLCNVRYADSMSLDFHKTGYSSYTTSMFLARDMGKFESLLSRSASHIVHHRTPYNPGAFTVEVSRSCAPALSAWATMRYFGARGYQTMIGGIVEMSHYLRELISKESTMVVGNEQDCGLLTAMRVYPKGVDAQKQWVRELTVDEEGVREEIKAHNDLQKRMADRVWELVTAGKKIQGRHPTCFNYSSAFCTTEYNDEAGEPAAIFYMIKSFPLNAHVTKKHMHDLVECLKALRDDVMDDLWKPIKPTSVYVFSCCPMFLMEQSTLSHCLAKWKL